MMQTFETTNVFHATPLKGEAEVARQAMVRFVAVDGDLHALTSRKMYGEI